jgi:hypothetical protein
MLPDLGADRQVMVAIVGLFVDSGFRSTLLGAPTGIDIFRQGLLCVPAVTTHLFCGEILWQWIR